MSIQKPKDTRPGAKSKAAKFTRRPSKVVKAALSSRIKHPRGRNAVKLTTPRSREAIPRSATSKRPSPPDLVRQSIRGSSKLAMVLAMLRSKQGATIAAMMKTTGWQQHSVRGFLTGVVRKRLKLDLTSEKPGKDRIYRTKVTRPSAAKTIRTDSMA